MRFLDGRGLSCKPAATKMPEKAVLKAAERMIGARDIYFRSIRRSAPYIAAVRGVRAQQHTAKVGNFRRRHRLVFSQARTTAPAATTAATLTILALTVLIVTPCFDAAFSISLRLKIAFVEW